MPNHIHHNILYIKCTHMTDHCCTFPLVSLPIIYQRAWQLQEESFVCKENWEDSSESTQASLWGTSLPQQDRPLSLVATDACEDLSECRNPTSHEKLLAIFHQVWKQHFPTQLQKKESVSITELSIYACSYHLMCTTVCKIFVSKYFKTCFLM